MESHEWDPTTRAHPRHLRLGVRHTDDDRYVFILGERYRQRAAADGFPAACGADYRWAGVAVYRATQLRWAPNGWLDPLRQSGSARRSFRHGFLGRLTEPR